jgi:protein-S-isoprenylcysteine O-methyltransferase Ste14
MQLSTIQKRNLVGNGLTWSALAGVLRLKSALEEQWLREKYVQYAAYSQVTRRFVPGLY